MNNYLTILYSQLFQNRDKEKQFMGNHDFPDKYEEVRNDQRISNCREQNKMLCYLIEKYIENHLK